MHWGSNVVCGEVGEGVAVLLRAIEPLAGRAHASCARRARDHDLASGPGKLSQAFGLDRSFDSADLVTGSHGIVIASDGTRLRPTRQLVHASASPARSISLGAGTSVTIVTYRFSHGVLRLRTMMTRSTNLCDANWTSMAGPIPSPWTPKASSWSKRGDARASRYAGGPGIRRCRTGHRLQASLQQH